MRSLIKKLLPEPILALFRQIRYIWIVMLFSLFRLVPLQKNKVVICNVWGFGDNAKYVTEELIKRSSEVGAIIFITNHPKAAFAPEGVRVLKTNSIAAVFALATARVWVDNNRKEKYIRKRAGQYYIQTWHGGIALKKIEKDYAHKLGEGYVKNAKRDSAMTNLYISNSSFCTNMYKKSFWYHGEILECGSPRTDILLHPDKDTMAKCRKLLGVEPDVNIAIYAPTYREGNNNTKPYELDFTRLLSVLTEKFGGKWVLAVRLHPLVASQSGFIQYNKQIINASHYRDIYELMAASDLMITDYSNIMFEFSFMKKPVFLYASDVEVYEKERGFYFSYDLLPYDKAKTKEELINNIQNYSYEIYQSKIAAFFNSLTLFEKGTASSAVVDRILKIME